MRTNVFHPVINHINTIPDSGTHVIELGDHSGGALDLFVRDDWSDWDALVAKVEEYRES